MEAVIQPSELLLLKQIAAEGAYRAAESFGQFSNNSLTVSRANARISAIEDTLCLYGDPEEIVVGVDFRISGDITGYLLTIFQRNDAKILLSKLIGSSTGDVENCDEMERSALGEAGNIIVSSFLSSLESLCGLVAVPSPPSVAVEMCGAVLSNAIVTAIEVDADVLLIETEIKPVKTESLEASACSLIFLPTPQSWVILNKTFIGPV